MKRKITAKSWLILTGALSLFAFTTFFLPPLAGNGYKIPFNKIYFPSTNYGGATTSLIAYVLILCASALFFVSAFVSNVPERKLCIISIVLLLIGATLLFFTPSMYVNSLTAPEGFNPEILAQIKQEQLEITTLSVGTISGIFLTFVSALFGAVCVRELKGK